MEMPKNIDKNMIAVCGVNCIACSAHLDKKKPCPTCRPLKEKHTRKSCANCTKKCCAFEKDLNWCFECEKFPCVKITNLNKKYIKNYNIDLVQNGIDAKNDMPAFLNKQYLNFTCNNCGGIIDQHTFICSECGI